MTFLLLLDKSIITAVVLYFFPTAIIGSLITFSPLTVLYVTSMSLGEIMFYLIKLWMDGWMDTYSECDGSNTF